MNIPKELLYSKDHEWALVEDNLVTVGVSEFAQDSLGEIVYLELPDDGRQIKKGDVFGVAESVKAVSDLVVPVGGTVTEVNQGAVENPGVVNDSPYEDGWLIKVEMEDDGDLEGLMDAEAYTKYLKKVKK